MKQETKATEPSVDFFVDKIKKRLLRLNKKMALNVRSFGDLHSFMDANCLGGFCDDRVADPLIEHFGGRDDVHEAMPDGFIEFMDTVQTRVDSWIRKGHFLAERFGFQWHNSGGGCWVHLRILDGLNLEFMMTDNQGDYMESIDSPVALGLFDSESGDQIEFWEFKNLPDALHAAQWFAIHFRKFIATRKEVPDGWFYGQEQEMGIYKTPTGPHLHIEQHEYDGNLWELEARLFLDWECAELYRGFRFPEVVNRPKGSRNA